MGGENTDGDAERRAEALLGDENINLGDQESVRNHLEQWASQWECRDTVDRKAISNYLDRLQQPNMTPADLVKTTGDFLKTMADRGVSQVHEIAPGTTRTVDYMLQNMRVAREAFASR